MSIVSTTPIHYRMRVLWALFELTGDGKNTATVQDVQLYFPKYDLVEYSLEGNVSLDRADVEGDGALKRFKINESGKEFLFGYLKQVAKKFPELEAYLSQHFPESLSETENARLGQLKAQEDTSETP